MAWNEGYVVEEAYTSGFFRKQSPVHLSVACALNGFEPVDTRKPFTYLELGSGQGFTANVLAAASPHARFFAADFMPGHVVTAQELAAVLLIAAWAVGGPFFGFSENWQLVINTGTTIITFLMVFVLQNTQNRDNEAIQAKLDELILTSQNAENRFIGIEKKAEREISDVIAEVETAACRSAS